MNIKAILLCLAGLAIFGSSSPASSAPRKKLVFSNVSGQGTQELASTVIGTFNILSQEFEIDLRGFPSARATAAADVGELDGVALRAKALESAKYSKNLLRVPTPIVRVKNYLIVREDTGEPFSWGDALRGWRIGMRLNSPAYEELIPKPSRVEVANSEQALKMLQAKRVDAGIIFEGTYWLIITEHPELGVGLRRSRLETSTDLYLYLHKNRRDCFEALNAELKKMAASGTIQRRWDEALQEIRRGASPPPEPTISDKDMPMKAFIE